MNSEVLDVELNFNSRAYEYKVCFQSNYMVWKCYLLHTKLIFEGIHISRNVSGSTEYLYFICMVFAKRKYWS